MIIGTLRHEDDEGDEYEPDGIDPVIVLLHARDRRTSMSANHFTGQPPPYN
jgi:hypothetical protein